MNTNTQIKSTKDLNKARIIFYIFILSITSLFLILISIYKELGELLFYAITGLIFIFCGIYWGIYLRYIPGNFRGGSSFRVTTGIKGRKAAFLGFFLIIMGAYMLTKALS